VSRITNTEAHRQRHLHTSCCSSWVRMNGSCPTLEWLLLCEADAVVRCDVRCSTVLTHVRSRLSAEAFRIHDDVQCNR
jgi:hypothetical protein